MVLALEVPVFAHETQPEDREDLTSVESENVSNEEFSFVPMTREEYIKSKALHQNMSYAEAEAELDSKIAAMQNIPTPLEWEPNKPSIDNGDTTYSVYGRVFKVYTDPAGFKVYYSVEAVKLTSNYGDNWVEILPESVYCTPYGNGVFKLEDKKVTAVLVSRLELRLSMIATVYITESHATSAGFNLELFSGSQTIGGEVYYRKMIEEVHIERCQTRH